ncbi:hypothetical protein CHS0354_041286 [Potamilus streckersoni]|uniref:Potassium channel domain-containing protein n=1 Tax=Potamilus streckersoni TaxID=2493646 RepID=A0AAE0VV08_9BIVA|nr:hypothetical protein CHS0354_041286 [Potamilus streckersoni]
MAEPEPQPTDGLLLSETAISTDGCDQAVQANGKHTQSVSNTTSKESTPASDLERSLTSSDSSTKALSRSDRFKDCMRQNFPAVVLIFLLVGYSFLGAVIFMYIEAPHEKLYKQNITETREELIQVLLNLSISLGTSNDDLTLRARDLLLQYEADIMTAYKQGVTSPSDKTVWNFWNSLIFCGTIYTTIGYGHIATVTDLGRGITMLYAAIGIPLAIIVLAELGKRFTIVLKYFWSFIRRYYYTGYCRKIPRAIVKRKSSSTANGKAQQNSKLSSIEEDQEYEIIYKADEIDDKFNLPIIVAVIILLLYIVLGSVMYTTWEKDWGFLEAFYFIFISLSTIGLGDIVPAHPKFFVISSVYVFIGLSLVSMCVNVAIEFFSKTAKETIKHAKKDIEKAKAKVTEAGLHAKRKVKDAKKKVEVVKANIQKEVEGVKTNIQKETTKLKQKARLLKGESFDSETSSRSGTDSERFASEKHGVKPTEATAARE